MLDERELHACPGSRHDDQIDAVSQALAHASRSLTMMDVV